MSERIRDTNWWRSAAIHPSWSWSCVFVSSLGLCPDGAEAQTLAVLSVGAEAAAELPPESDRTKSIRNHVAGRHKESEWAPAPPHTGKQTVSTHRRTEDHVEQLLNSQEGTNNAELVRDRVSHFVEFLLMKQLLKSPHLLRESGDVATRLLLLLLALCRNVSSLQILRDGLFQRSGDECRCRHRGLKRASAFSRLFVEVFCSCSESSGCWSIWCQCDRRAGCRSEGDSQPDCWWSPPQGRPPAAPPLSYNQEKPSSKTTTLSLLFVKCSDWVIFTDHIDKRWKSNVWIFSHVSTSFGHWQVQTVIKAPDSIVETSSQIKLRILLV